MSGCPGVSSHPPGFCPPSSAHLLSSTGRVSTSDWWTPSTRMHGPSFPCILYLGRVLVLLLQRKGSVPLAVQWLKLCASDAGGMRSILGQGMKISHATWHGQRGKKEVYALPSLGKSRLEKFSFVRQRRTLCFLESLSLHSKWHR